MPYKYNAITGELDRVDPSNAASITTDTTNFDGWLSASDTDVQKSLDTLDDILTAGGIGTVLAGDTGLPKFIGPLTDGQLLIGDTGNDIAAAALTSTDGSIGITNGAGSIDLSSLGQVQDQIYYVGKHGNDANDGKTIGKAVLTFTQALVLASAQTPTALNKFAIVCLDDGIYAENLTAVQYVDIFAPNATLGGNITLVDEVMITFSSQIVASGTIGLVKGVGTSYAFVDIENIDLLGTAIGVVATSGFINISFKRMSVVNGVGIGDISSALQHIHIKGGDIYVTGTGIGIARIAAGTIVGRVDHLLDTGGGNGTAIFNTLGTMDLEVSRIEGFAVGLDVNSGSVNLLCNTLESTTAYDVAAAGTLNLVVNELSGTQTNAGTLSLLRGDGESLLNAVTSTALTDTSRTQHAVSIYGASGALSEVGPLTNGQLVVGSTGNAPSAATLTAGTGISITNAAGSVTIDGTGGGLTWSTKSANDTLAVNEGFLCTGGAALSFALPATSAVGDTISLGLDGSTSWTVTQGANQQIRIGSSTTTLGAGGSLASTAQGDTITMVCVTANLTWLVTSSMGNITVV